MLLTAKGKRISRESSASVCSRVQRRRLPEGLARDVSIASPLAIEMNNCRLSSSRDESFLARSGIPLSLPYSEGEKKVHLLRRMNWAQMLQAMDLP